MYIKFRLFDVDGCCHYRKNIFWRIYMYKMYIMIWWDMNKHNQNNVFWLSGILKLNGGDTLYGVEPNKYDLMRENEL